jgi:hypothetical protein
MIARCTKCGQGHDLRPIGKKKVDDFRCEVCGGLLEPADLRWCVACGTTTEDIHLMAPYKSKDIEITVTLPNDEIPAVRYFVAPGTTHCRQGHPFRPIARKALG